MKVKIINTSAHPDPAYATAHAAGMDLKANLTQPVVLAPLQRELISTGLFIELPMGCEAQIRPRSGMAYKQGVTVLNSPGTIDADYRGEVKVLLVNLSDKNVTIENGDRIAQMVVATHATVEWQQADKLLETVRGEGGFGHTGNQ